MEENLIMGYGKNKLKLLRIPYAKQNKLDIQYIEKFISPIISNVY